MMQRVALVVLVICACAFAQEGVVALLTQNGLAYAGQQGLTVLQQKIQSMTVNVPDQSGSQDSIDWTISDIVISGFALPSLSVAFAAGSGLSLQTADITATINANWHAREKIWPHPSGSGSATIYISSVSMNTVVNIGEQNGRLSVGDSNTGVSIGNLDIHFSGSGLDWVLNLLKSLFEGTIKNAAESGISNGINNAINSNLESLLQSLPDTKAINSILSINYGITSSPIITSSYISVPINGEFYLTSSNTYPKTPSAMPLTDGNEMLQVVVNDFVPNSAFNVYYKAGLMTYTITPTMVPQGSPVQFNTSQWGDLVPPLPVKYPDYLMQAVAYASGVPSYSTFTTGAQLLLPSQVEFQVLTPKTNQPITAFILNVDVTADVTVAVVANNITGKLTYFNATISLASSAIGPFDPSPLEQILLYGLDSIVGPQINSYLIQGFPIPTFDGVDLVDPTIGLGNSYVVVSTNVQYTPPL